MLKMNHLKNLYNITKEESLYNAIDFDLERTQDDLENLVEKIIVVGAAIISGIISVPSVIYKTLTKRFRQKEGDDKIAEKTNLRENKEEDLLARFAFECLSSPNEKIEIDNEVVVRINSWTEDEVKRKRLFCFYERMKNPRYLKLYKQTDTKF